MSDPGLLDGGNRHLGEEIALVEVLDRVIAKGVVLAGDITLSVADIDLIDLGLQLYLVPAGRSARSTASR